MGEVACAELPARSGKRPAGLHGAMAARGRIQDRRFRRHPLRNPARRYGVEAADGNGPSQGWPAAGASLTQKAARLTSESAAPPMVKRSILVGHSINGTRF